MLDSVSRWLRDGDDHAAAELISQCEIETHFVDLFFEVGGGRDYEVYDLNVAAPRRVHIALSQSTELSSQIEDAIRGCAQSEGMHVRSINWIPLTASPDDELHRVRGLTLTGFDAGHVARFWQKCLDRKAADPDGAITAARSMLESVCKHILDARGEKSDRGTNLPSLFNATLKCLSMTPREQTDDAIRRLLGNCQSIVSGIASVRNDIGDAHGKHDGEQVASSIEAEFAVNLASSVATYMLHRAKSEVSTATG